jgi:hypothetical protein
MASIEKTIGFLQEKFRKLTSEQVRRLVLVCTAVFVSVLTFSVIISIRKPAGEKPPVEIARQEIRSAIPPEEIFLPDEPDFIPGVLLERDRRSNWTEKDAAEYWHDPLMYGEEQWREKIEKTIDEFMERIP